MPSATARLTLDARQLAMLAEMGIRLWSQPEPTADADDAVHALAGNPRATPPALQGLPLAPQRTTAFTPAPAPASTPTSTPAPAHRAAPGRPAPEHITHVTHATTHVGPAADGRPKAPAPAQSTPALAVPGLAGLDWSALRARLAQSTLPEGEPRVLSGHGDAGASWLFICDAPGPAPVSAPSASGPAQPAEQLLDNMLRACGLSRQAGAFMAYVHHVSGDDGLVRAWLEHLIEMLRPQVVLLMSRHATQSLLQTREPPGRLRGQPLAAHGVPVVVSYPPALLLGRPDNKARAWADLCRARAIVAPAA